MSSNRMRVAGAPVSFGVDEIMMDDAWMPEPLQVLDWLVDIDVEGTELGPPGYLGDAATLRESLTVRNLELVGSFMPLHFSRNEVADEDRAWLADNLRLITDGAPDGSRPMAILSDQFDEPDRKAFSGQIPSHPETWLSPARFDALIDNMHRAAETCRAAGFDVVVHPHAGTYIETADEIARVMDRLDTSLVGLCLDTGHFRFGGFDPTKAVNDYHDLIRHVHIKDCTTKVMDDAIAAGTGLEGALRNGVFCELGTGDSGIDSVIEALRTHDYAGWLVIEQDQFLMATDTPESVLAVQRANREYLRPFGI